MPPVYLHQIATLTPRNAYAQRDIGEVMLAQLDPESMAARFTRRVYPHSGIETRYSVIEDYARGSDDGLFLNAATGRFKTPSTAARNDFYTAEARTLFSGAAGSLLKDVAGLAPEDVTHVITVSCTGFFAPGPDFYLVKDLHLRPDTQRVHIGYMGCYGAFPALRMAYSICRADPEAVVLVVCVELCTIHLRATESIDDILAGSVFSDGAAAAVVSVRDLSTRPVLRMEHFSSMIAPDSEGDMAWRIGDFGFEMVLSTNVPRILREHAATIVKNSLQATGRGIRDIARWAIHPGGKAILDHIEQALGFEPDVLEASRSVLRRYGNMSSATILFVLKDILEMDGTQPPESVYAMAFGPGLTMESALFLLE